jgi:hypothetical protein
MALPFLSGETMARPMRAVARELTENQNQPVDSKVGWRISEWANDTGLSRAYVYLLLGAGTISSVKSGNARIITTSPKDYLASLAGDVA